MPGRSLLRACLLLLALGIAAPGAAQVVDDPYWATAAGDRGAVRDRH